MRTQTPVRSTKVIWQRLHAFEEVLAELSLEELHYLHGVLQRRSDEASQSRVDIVRKEIDGRRSTHLQPSVAAL
jgi:hypothetical protein